MQFVPELGSTNTFLADLARKEPLPDGYTVYTYRQMHGRGQRGNRWESEPDANVLFSVLWHLQQLPVGEQFVISQIASLCVRNVAARYVEGVTIKWPNDIYCGDNKLAGMLIETVFEGPLVRQAIVGIGLNVNQTVFPGHLPNPVSLAQMTGRQYDKYAVLEEMTTELARLRTLAFARPDDLRRMYFEHLYRAGGFYPYRADGVLFDAEIADILTDGVLVLRLRDGQVRRFFFKEVEFVL